MNKVKTVAVIGLVLGLAATAYAAKPADAGAKGAEHKAAAQAKRDCIKQAAADHKAAIQALVKSDGWKTATDEEKEAQIKGVNDAFKAAKQACGVGGKGSETTDSTTGQ